ncbi:MAG: CDP-diacylglycerol--glycerol-3-phosphate 3-phosphatidyltransferase [Spirochaetales bacterium]|nr:CDP-diacylglycerol--glycerol-3-phosphate 3-phosphatidyltransferase [Spirochaetales bacterium]
MNVPTRLTVLRIVLSPVFFVVWFFPLWTGKGFFLSAVLLIVLFIVQEVTDVLDGAIARKQGLVTDLGKVLDPFADVMSRMTFFICFTGTGFMPLWIFTLLIYRELAMTFLRLLMIRQGVALAASIWGKLKAVVYNIAGIAGVAIVALSRFGVPGDVVDILKKVALYIFLLAAFSSMASFATYAVRALRLSTPSNGD